MATVFNTQVGNGKYCLQFETDNKEHYMLVQSLVRLCIDRANVDENDPERTIYLEVGKNVLRSIIKNLTDDLLLIEKEES